jgi:hypothetical protein
LLIAEPGGGRVDVFWSQSASATMVGDCAAICFRLGLAAAAE